MSKLRLLSVLTLALAMVVVSAVPAFGQGRPRPDTWADGERFAGVVTPATFKPSSGNFDELYTCGEAGSFEDGVGLISESKPGDQDYNGGRWHLNVLKEGAECDDTAVSVEDLVLDDFESTDMYFECPLLPRRGGNG